LYVNFSNNIINNKTTTTTTTTNPEMLNIDIPRTVFDQRQFAGNIMLFRWTSSSSSLTTTTTTTTTTTLVYA
jgi:hypothetical protein